MKWCRGSVGVKDDLSATPVHGVTVLRDKAIDDPRDVQRRGEAHCFPGQLSASRAERARIRKNEVVQTLIR